MLRGSIYACLIFLGEFCSGSLLKKYDLCPWDYSNARWNICGLIRLDYAHYGLEPDFSLKDSFPSQSDHIGSHKASLFVLENLVILLYDK